MLLPRTLLALALLAAALPLSDASSSDPSEVSTNFDPFRSIVLKHRALHPGPPLCCLKPPPAAASLLAEGPEDALLSFEEWKSRQMRVHAAQTAAASAPRADTASNADGDGDDPTSGGPAVTPLADYASTASAQDASYPRDVGIPPHFRVPLTDRFNYANMDCSARVHMAHRSAKSASSILSSKKDRYMLSPCTGAASSAGVGQKNAGTVGEAQFVVVELCDDIRIDTVQLASFEFFSGVFKDFSVRVAKTYPAAEDGWTVAGTYRAKNIRGVQVRVSMSFFLLAGALLTLVCVW